ncbi:MAG: universal stress protein [Pseudomonadota bacterium]
MFEKILAVIDPIAWGTHTHVLEITCDLAQKYEAEIHLVHCSQLIAQKPENGPRTTDLEKFLIQGTQIISDAVETVRIFGCVPTNCVIANGEPEEELSNLIEKTKADLIIISKGNSEHSEVYSILLNSILSHNDCVVMAVPGS